MKERLGASLHDDTLCLGKVSETNFYETSFIRIIKNLKPFVLFLNDWEGFSLFEDESPWSPHSCSFST
jgi:hypothetical protein